MGDLAPQGLSPTSVMGTRPRLPCTAETAAILTDSEETRVSVLETLGQEAKVHDRLPPKKPAAGTAS